MDIIGILIILGISCSVLLQLILIFSNDRSNTVLSTLLFCFLLTVSSGLYYHYHWFLHMPHFLYVHINIAFLISPLVYFYIKASISEKIKYNKYLLLHLIPFCIIFIVLLPVYRLSGEEKIQFIINHIISDSPQDIRNPAIYLIPLALQVQFWSYIIMSKRFINRNKIKFEANPQKYKWIQLFLIMIIGMNIIMFLLRVLFLLNIISAVVIWGISFTFATLMVYSITIMGLQSHTIFYNKNFESWYTKDYHSVRQKHNETSTQFNERQEYMQRLDTLIIQQRLFTDDNITLTDLADHLRVSNNFLSKIINEQTGLSFYEYINKYRIEEAKRIIQTMDDTNLNFLHIAYECGFNSKATFYRAFKKITNMTPSVYKKEHMCVSQKSS